MMPQLLQNLRDTNRRLTLYLDSLATQRGQPEVINPELMGSLLSELLSAGVVLRAQPVPFPCSDPGLQMEMEKYGGNVERLRNLMPSIHTRLLAERARLEVERARIKSVAEWARASRQTL